MEQQSNVSKRGKVADGYLGIRVVRAAGRTGRSEPGSSCLFAWVVGRNCGRRSSGDNVKRVDMGERHGGVRRRWQTPNAKVDRRTLWSVGGDL